ncbi:MAG: anthranilate synthase component I family protein [Thermoplasmatota archaeon]
MLLRALDLPFDPSADFARTFHTHETGFLLESAEGPERLARYSILGFDPVARITFSRRGGLRISGEAPDPRADESPLAYLRRVVASRAVLDQGYRYLGGLVGQFSYEYVENLERIPPRAPSDAVASQFPQFEFGLYLDGVVFDRLTERVIYFSHGRDRSREIEALAKERPPDTSVTFGAPRENMERSRFTKAVETAKHAIHEGEIFQVVLSRRFDASYTGDLLAFYHALKRLNPSPYMYYLKSGERHIVGSSPEMLARVDGGRVETFPIAGTRPLGADEAETERLAADLLADPKELAEHAMLVDLARNDVGRVAEYGTVRVSESKKVERYSHVQHLVSKVEGRLRPGRSAFDALDAVFPAGTVSGAPKVRAMEIIRELEPDARGPYAGAIGYFSFNGNADAAIAIRTLVAANGHASVQAGAGIVYDSDPEREFEETQQKMRALRVVMGHHGGAGAAAARAGGGVNDR